MTDSLRREIRIQAARRAVQALGLTQRQVRAQVRRWGRVGPPRSMQAEYWRTITRLMRAAADTMEAPTDAQVRAAVRPHGMVVVRWNGRKYDTPLGAALGLASPPAPLREPVRLDALDPDLESRALESWTRENVALIKGATQDQIDKITALIYRAQRDGTRARDLESQIAAIVAGGRRRAKVIARDQVNKFNGQLDRLKQTDVGIDAYIWRTSGDERVRSSHRRLNGKRFPWDKPPAEGHPGQPVQCRCQPEPDLADLLGPELGAPTAPPTTREARSAPRPTGTPRPGR